MAEADSKEIATAGRVSHDQGIHQTDTIEMGDQGASKPAPFQPPEIIRAMTPEQRAAAEKKLLWKIDMRLLPMIIIMYILNYIDRCVRQASSSSLYSCFLETISLQPVLPAWRMT